MSILHPQIRSHRAMAEALKTASIMSKDPLVGNLLGGMSAAHSIAADSLEESDRALEAKFAKIDGAKADG